jgi:TolA-binding protein
MKVILSVVGVLAFMLGVFFVIASKGAGNDVAAAVIILVGIVALGFSGVIDVIEQSNNRLVEALARQGDTATPRAAGPLSRPVAAATPEAADDEARALIKQAEDLQFASKFKDARVTYAAVVERFPESRHAATAEQQLENLRNA